MFEEAWNRVFGCKYSRFHSCIKNHLPLIECPGCPDFEEVFPPDDSLEEENLKKVGPVNGT